MEGSNINTSLLITIFDNLKSVINSKQSWDEIHHTIYYRDMTVRMLYEADKYLMSQYVPIISSNRSECLHLLHHIEKKVAYLKGFV